VLPFAIVLAVAVVVLLLAEWRGSVVGKWIAKPIASGTFVAAAVSCGAAETAYGRWVLVALGLSWWGDVLLIPKSQKVFLVGILAFLAGHLGYLVAFVARGVSVPWTLGAAVALALVGVPVGRWFVVRAPAKLKIAVAAYVTVLSSMVALAIGTYGARGAPLIVVSAVAFYLSDISVALDRFVRPSIVNRLWGLPLYFGAQLLFASTTAERLP
jgi:uncharacterized membrane protein YhhN